MANGKATEADKLRGGYYTPRFIAEALVSWAVRAPSDRVLEPSCGDGVFLAAAARRLLALGASPGAAARQVTGVELVEGEARKAAEAFLSLVGHDATVHRGDFFSFCDSGAFGDFDCVVGNPPFIRYHDFPERSRLLALNLMLFLGLRANRLTNAWVPFVVASVNALRTGGRLGMVLPAELLQVSYASQLRGFLVDSFERITLVTCNRMLFAAAEQEVLLLLADGRRPARTAGGKCRIATAEVETAEQLVAKLDHRARFAGALKTVNHETEKWIKYFLSPREISLMRELRASDACAQLRQFAEVDVGIVTGRNEFFVLSRHDVERFALHPYVVPLIGRSAQLSGAIVTSADWRQLGEDGERVYLFDANSNGGGGLSAEAQAYVALGEKRGCHTTYKCSVRTPWYAVPSVWLPDCFLFRQIYDFPRVVLNEAQATSTDTIHRVKCRAAPRAFAENVYTHLTAASAEIEGRSYGGGVLELEPTEAEKLLVPRELGSAVRLEEVDRLVRAGRLQDVLIENDRLVLMERMGLSRSQCSMLRRIWSKLRERRRARSRSSLSPHSAACGGRPL
ncbi:MAG: SAM-dependent methyltransferase [Planctomycetes bacterium]|nr:SAM-dependent methyltransferase [Planctomycetota bacterium]